MQPNFFLQQGREGMIRVPFLGLLHVHPAGLTHQTATRRLLGSLKSRLPVAHGVWNRMNVWNFRKRLAHPIRRARGCSSSCLVFPACASRVTQGEVVLQQHSILMFRVRTTVVAEERGPPGTGSEVDRARSLGAGAPALPSARSGGMACRTFSLRHGSSL